jgi:hypothetical protein
VRPLSPSPAVRATSRGKNRQGAQINADLVAEETRRAVAACRDPFSAESEARLCELVLGERRPDL